MDVIRKKRADKPQDFWPSFVSSQMQTLSEVSESRPRSPYVYVACPRNGEHYADVRMLTPNIPPSAAIAIAPAKCKRLNQSNEVSKARMPMRSTMTA